MSDAAGAYQPSVMGLGLRDTAQSNRNGSETRAGGGDRSAPVTEALESALHKLTAAAAALQRHGDLSPQTGGESPQPHGGRTTATLSSRQTMRLNALALIGGAFTAWQGAARSKARKRVLRRQQYTGNLSVHHDSPAMMLAERPGAGRSGATDARPRRRRALAGDMTSTATPAVDGVTGGGTIRAEQAHPVSSTQDAHTSSTTLPSDSGAAHRTPAEHASLDPTDLEITRAAMIFHTRKMTELQAVQSFADTYPGASDKALTRVMVAMESLSLY